MHKQTMDSKLALALKDKLAEKYDTMTDALGDLSIYTEAGNIRSLMSDLKNLPDFRFEQMIDLTAVDYQNEDRPYRFEVVYHLLSLTHDHRLRIKCRLSGDNPTIDSIHDIWAAADWYERECFDMFGIVFSGHPNLKRIIMYDGFIGHPLRKDYPITREQPLVELKEIKERHTYLNRKT